MGSFGRIEEFNNEEESFSSYSERMAQYFIANDITDDGKKRAIFLSVVGAKTYNLLRTLLHPSKPSDSTFDTLVKKLEEHFNPKPSPIVQRCKFNTCFRKQGQTVADFIAELRKLSEYCDYGSSLSDMIRDRLVAGINDDAMQKRLLTTDYASLDLKKAQELCLAMEAANRDIRDLATAKSPHQNSASVNKVTFKKPNYGPHKHSSNRPPNVSTSTSKWKPWLNRKTN